MQESYVVIKCGRDTGGEVVFASAEKVFREKAAAEEYVKSQGPVVWEEVIQGFQCYCERAIHLSELI